MDLNTVWFVLIAVLFIGYFVLEGFDFGVGILTPILGHDDEERRLLIRTIGPFWDANEVWLLTAGGALLNPHALLGSLPDGLETRVGERGSRLSAGERQRLRLARLMLSDAPLVLVDEPTAHLDAETERDVLCTLRDWAHGRAMLLVTHRPAGLEGMDRILRLDAGVLTSV